MFEKIINFITNKKTLRIISFVVIVVLVLLFLRQCNSNSNLKQELYEAKTEIKRVDNNLIASKDTLIQFQLDKNTWRGEKKGYVIKYDELKHQYSNLLGDFKLVKNRPPKTIINTVYKIKDSIIRVPVYIVDGDSVYDNYIVFSDSINYDSLGNNRYLSGTIPFNYNYKDSSIITTDGTFVLELGMNLNLGLFRDSKTREVSIQADTDFPGVTFTNLDGAYVLDTEKDKKILRQFRKQWSLGISIGYGIMYDIKSSDLRNGPYIGIGLNYQPKILQW